MLVSSLLLLASIVCAEKMQLGYPKVIKVTNKAKLCPLQIDIPEGTSKVRFLVDVNVPLTQTAVIYAQPGSVVERSAEHRVSADQVGDTEVTIPNPKPGLWTIGVYGTCQECITPLKKSFDPRISATLYTLLDDPVIDMTPEFESAYVGVVQGRMGFFRFTVPKDGAKAHFKLSPNLDSQGDVLHTYLRKNGLPDLNDLDEANPEVSQLSLSGIASKSGSVTLTAGQWTLGVLAEKSRIGGRSHFSLSYAIDHKPMEPKLPVYDQCPTDAAEAETGVWDPCTLLDCESCRKTEGCGYCSFSYNRYAESSECQKMQADGKCQGRFELIPDARLPADQECPACKYLSCDECVKSATCSYCMVELPFGENKFVFGCESGPSCKASVAGYGVKPVVDTDICTKPLKDLDFDSFKDIATNVTTVVTKLGGGVIDKAAGIAPTNEDGQFLPPSGDDPCKDLTKQCKDKCNSNIKRCSCGPDGPDIVCRDSSSMGEPTTEPTTASSFTLSIALIVCVILLKL